MSTLADELLNDFEDSGSEGDADRQNGLLHDAPSSPASNVNFGRVQSITANGSAGVMVLDVDEEDDDEDEEMTNAGALEDAEDEEEAKAKVEKMQLGGINDVRNVAGLMKTLEPVLQVGVLFFLASLCQLYVKVKVYISCDHSPDVLRRIQKIAQYQALPPDKQTTFVGSIEDNPEYHLLTQSNNI